MAVRVRSTQGPCQGARPSVVITGARHVMVRTATVAATVRQWLLVCTSDPVQVSLNPLSSLIRARVLKLASIVCGCKLDYKVNTGCPGPPNQRKVHASVA